MNNESEPRRPFRELFATIKHLPFLFIGSGLSRRYMNLPNWEDLLRLFASKIHPDNPLALEVFSSKVPDRNWPVVSSLIEQEFNALWLTDPEYKKQRKTYANAIKSGISPFKLELASYFRSAEKSNDAPHLIDELSCLANAAKRSVAGIITTNYDLLPEQIFKGYTTFIGQEQLLFGDTHGVSEIYKIHGCCSRPESIVINESDYKDFERRNAYLAAKLLTVFVEHPVIFLGYSLSDPNIQAILSSIIDCLSEQNLQVLQQRLIFVEYKDQADHAPEIAEHSVSFRGGTRAISMTKITLNDFLPLYAELCAQRYQYNPRLLRQLKRDIYLLVSTNEPVDRFQIQDIEDDQGLEKVGVLAGIGVIPEVVVSDRGHHIPDPPELFCDVVFDDRNFDLKSLVEDALPKLQRSHSRSLPVHKYVSAYRAKFRVEPPVELLTDLKESVDDLLSRSLRNAQPIASVAELQQLAPSPEKWFELFPRLHDFEATLPELEQYLRNYLRECPAALATGKSGDKTNLKRVIRIYDFLKYGKAKTPKQPRKRAKP